MSIIAGKILPLKMGWKARYGIDQISMYPLTFLSCIDVKAMKGKSKYASMTINKE